MSKAYRCDGCGSLHDGTSELELHFDARPIARSMIGVKYTTDSDRAPIYPHDLCEPCMKSFIDWWKGRKK